MDATQLILGVDPGARGGLAWLAADGTLAHLAVMPYLDGRVDGRALARALRLHPVRLAGVEAVHAMPKQGVVSMFNFGASWGAILGVLAALDVRTVLVTPQRWQRAVLGKLEAGAGKSAALAYCLKRWPAAPWVRPRCRKAHDGMVDAACIAAHTLATDQGES